LPISYVEPAEPNAAAVGLDMAHEAITGPIVLVKDEQSPPGFLFLQFAGSVYAPFVVQTPRTTIVSRVDSNVLSVNIGALEHVEHNGRDVETGIFKMPTTERQQVSGIHVGDDLQADTDAHGGEHKAIYAYAAEDYAWWSERLDQELNLGFFGENLTTTGVDVSGALVGDRWTIGTTVLEVSEPRIPCFKLTIRAGIPRFQQTFARADRPGAYFRIVKEGQLIVGDDIAVERTTHDSISVANISIIYHRERERAGALEHVRGLSEPWKRWARDQAS